MEHYEQELRHVARPDSDYERSVTPKAPLADYEALYLARLLRDYAAYNAAEDQRNIAWAYAEYIDMVVRDEGRSAVVIYAHTPLAHYVLEQAVLSTNGGETQLQQSVRQSIDLIRREME